MGETLQGMVIKYYGGIPIGANTPSDMLGLLDTAFQEKEETINELLGHLAEIRDRVLGNMWYLDREKYEELLGPCIGSPVETVRAVEILCGYTELPKERKNE